MEKGGNMKKYLFGEGSIEKRPLRIHINSISNKVLSWAKEKGVKEGDMFGFYCGESDWDLDSFKKIQNLVEIIRNELKATPVLVSCHTRCVRDIKLAICRKLGIYFAVRSENDLFEIEAGQQLNLFDEL